LTCRQHRDDRRHQGEYGTIILNSPTSPELRTTDSLTMRLINLGVHNLCFRDLRRSIKACHDVTLPTLLPISRALSVLG
jgi:hypothetical protein